MRGRGRQVGRWGEALVAAFLRRLPLGAPLPGGGRLAAPPEWMNEDGESGAPYDVRIAVERQARSHRIVSYRFASYRIVAADEIVSNRIESYRTVPGVERRARGSSALPGGGWKAEGVVGRSGPPLWTLRCGSARVAYRRCIRTVLARRGRR